MRRPSMRWGCPYFIRWYTLDSGHFPHLHFHSTSSIYSSQMNFVKPTFSSSATISLSDPLHSLFILWSHYRSLNCFFDHVIYYHPLVRIHFYWWNLESAILVRDSYSVLHWDLFFDWQIMHGRSPPYSQSILSHQSIQYCLLALSWSAPPRFDLSCAPFSN